MQFSSVLHGPMKTENITASKNCELKKKQFEKVFVTWLPKHVPTDRLNRSQEHLQNVLRLKCLVANAYTVFIRLSAQGRLSNFWTFRVGAYSRWVLGAY